VFLKEQYHFKNCSESVLENPIIKELFDLKKNKKSAIPPLLDIREGY